MIEVTESQRCCLNWAERRETPRLRYCTSVHLLSESNFYTGFSANLSEGGIFVATHALRPTGTPIVAEFTLPDGGPPIVVESEVRWVCSPEASERPGMGLKFQRLAEDDRRRIEAFVARRETLFFDED